MNGAANGPVRVGQMKEAILSQPGHSSEHQRLEHSLASRLKSYHFHVKEKGASIKDNFPQKPTTGTAAASFPSSTALLFSVAATA